MATQETDVRLSFCVLGPDDRLVVAGDDSGRVHFLRLVLPVDPP